MAINLNELDWTDLKNYPNAGKLPDGKYDYFSFNGNGLIRSYNHKLAMTEEAMNEWKKCKDDIYYFIQTYVRILDQEKGMIVPELRDYQFETLDCYLNNNYVLNKSARRSGKTVIASIYILHKILFNEAFVVGIVANQSKLVGEIIGNMRSTFELLPPFLQVGVRKFNATSLEFENGSKVVSATMGPNSLRGVTAHLVYSDEFSWAEPTKIQAFMDSVFPIISASKNNQIIITTTPKGFDKFHALWQNSVEKLNDFVRIEVKWDRIPGRDQAWWDAEVARSGIEYCMQNHAVAFLGSSKTLLTMDALMHLSSQKKKHIDTLDWIHQDIKVYEYPVEEEKSEGIFYSLSLDSAKISGTSSTNSDFVSLQVTKFDTNRKKIYQVCTMKTKDLHYTELSDIVYEVATYYHNALVLIENNSEGQGIVDRLFEIHEYENIYSDSKRHDVLGYRTTKSTKSRNLSNMKKLIESGILEVIDIDTIDEFFTFVQTGSTFKAIAESHDDSIMALAGTLHFLNDSSNEMDFSINDIFERSAFQSRNEDESEEDIDWVGTTKRSQEIEDANWLFG